jgi:hypothetical protein
MVVSIRKTGGFGKTQVRETLICLSLHIYIAASSNVCKIIAFSGIIAGGIFFCLRTGFAFFSCCMCLPVLKRRKNPAKRRKKPMKWQNKLRAQNVETATAKKTGNSENLGNRR